MELGVGRDWGASTENQGQLMPKSSCSLVCSILCPLPQAELPQRRIPFSSPLHTPQSLFIQLQGLANFSSDMPPLYFSDFTISWARNITILLPPSLSIRTLPISLRGLWVLKSNYSVNTTRSSRDRNPSTCKISSKVWWYLNLQSSKAPSSSIKWLWKVDRWN